MQNLEEIKTNWKGGTQQSRPGDLDKSAWQTVLKQQAKKQKNLSMQYFWASFIYQIIVYGFLVHVIIKYWGDPMVLLTSVFCLLLYVPFMIVLMQKFKRMAVLKQNENPASDLSIKQYIQDQHSLLSSFYAFKTRYEIVLVPFSSAIFVWIFFRFYFPNGVFDYPTASILLFIVVLGACSAAIFAENQRNFKKPMKKLEEILKDMNTEINQPD